MIIKKLHIENFGKLSNLDLNFSDGVNQIYKENGWGKSTLTTFVKSMFYGMPAKARGDAFNYERSKNLPWQGGNYGGFIEFTLKNGKNYRVTRFFDKTPEGDTFECIDLETNRVLPKQNEELGQELFGLGRESFEVTAFFPQLKFTSTTNSQITASLTGVDKFQNDLANANKAIKILDTNHSALKKEKPKKEEIELLKRKLNENKIDYSILAKQIEEEKENLKANKIQIDVLEKIIKTETENVSLKTERFEQKQNIEKQLLEKSDILNKTLAENSQIKDEITKQKTAQKQIKNKNAQKVSLIVIPIISVLLCVVMAVLAMFKVVSSAICISVCVVILAGTTAGIVVIIKNLRKLEKITVVEDDDLKQKLNLSIKSLQEINNEVYKLKELMKPFEDAQNPDRDRLNKLEDEYHKLEIQIISSSHDLKNLNFQLDNIIESNEKTQNEINARVEKMNDIEYKMSLIEKTKSFLLQAQENVSTRFIVPINNKFKSILNQFDIFDREFVIDTSWNVLENTPVGTKEFQYSSQGLQDIISFCQRINLIEEIYKKERPIIILDDTFVNLDDKKMDIAKEIVKQLSKDFQILYICCNSRCVIN